MHSKDLENLVISLLKERQSIPLAQISLEILNRTGENLPLEEIFENLQNSSLLRENVINLKVLPGRSIGLYTITKGIKFEEYTKNQENTNKTVNLNIQHSQINAGTVAGDISNSEISNINQNISRTDLDEIIEIIEKLCNKNTTERQNILEYVRNQLNKIKTLKELIFSFKDLLS